MIRKLFFLLVLLCLNSSCSMATLDAKSTDNFVGEKTVDPVVVAKENAALSRERHREMILARLEHLGRKQ